ncbi:MAG: HK97 family phage prohead protease [Rhodospirillaceae bacterium]
MKFTIERAVPLADLEVKGRTVTAYAAAFDSPASVYDPQFTPARHLESVARSAFTRALNAGAGPKAKVLFNHGKTIDGTPSERFSMPIATPVDVRADGRGLLTVSRYAATDLADEVLELIRNESVTGQSFRGPVYNYAERGGIVELTECGLREYGPCPFPAYADAEIVSIRSATDLMVAVEELTPEQRAELARLLTSNPDTPVEGPDPAPADAGTADVTPDEDSSNPAPTPGGDLDLLALANARRRLDI